MKIAVTGYKGRLGSELVEKGCIPLDCDITSGQSVLEAIAEVKPATIINCAAITDVDKCETEEGNEEALRVNFRGAMTIRNNFRGHLVQISTDYVFDCTGGAYSEECDDLNPVNRYGWSKYGAEAALTSVFSDHRTTIVRTTGLYGSKQGKPDFASNVINSLCNRNSFNATEELYGNQTYIPHLVEALLKVARLFEYKNRDIIHIGSKEVISRWEFAVMIADVFGLDKSLIVPCKNDEIFGWKAKRPTKGGLKTDLAVSYGLPIYSIRDGLEDFKERLENV